MSVVTTGATPGFPTPTPHTSRENSPEQEESPASSYGRVVHMPPKVIDWNNWPGKNYHPEDYGSYGIDYLDEIDRNREWLYVSPYPLRINQTLIDPVSVDPLADPVNSRIIPCPHHLKIESNFSDLFNDCAACDNKDDHVHKSIKWIMDSGASKAFTSQISDFSDLIYYAPGNELKVSTANGWATIVAYGTVFIEMKPLGKSHFLRLHPVYLLPGMTARLMSMGQVLRSKLCIYGDENTLTFMHAESNEIVLLAKSNLIHENIFWVDTQIITGQSLTTLNAINDDSYDLWHQRLGHPSDQVLIKFKTKTRNFPSNLTIPHNPPICEGCAKGKMRSRSFPENPIRATKPFERIHSDLREYPVLSYSKYKYYISFLDDCTSHAWIILLRKKTEALAATEQFLNMVKTQFRASVQEWFSDNGGEYQSDDYLALLKNRGIIIYRSVPRQPQMNGRAERFNQTIDTKSESMRHKACLPPSWWEFAVLHGLFLYNRTPFRRSKWITPRELVTKDKPDLSNLKVFGCGAYVYIPEKGRANKLSPKSELMIFHG